MFKYTYTSELQGIPSKLELHAIPDPDRNIVLHTDQEQTIITNHLEIRLILLTASVIVEWQVDITNPASWNFLLQERNRNDPREIQTIIIHPPLQKEVKRTKTL